MDSATRAISFNHCAVVSRTSYKKLSYFFQIIILIIKFTLKITSTDTAAQRLKIIYVPYNLYYYSSPQLRSPYNNDKTCLLALLPLHTVAKSALEEVGGGRLRTFQLKFERLSDRLLRIGGGGQADEATQTVKAPQRQVDVHTCKQRAAVASWLARRYANPKVRGSNPDRLRIFMVQKAGSTLGTGDAMLLVVRTPRKTVAPVS